MVADAVTVEPVSTGNTPPELGKIMGKRRCCPAYKRESGVPRL